MYLWNWFPNKFARTRLIGHATMNMFTLSTRHRGLSAMSIFIAPMTYTDNANQTVSIQIWVNK